MCPSLHIVVDASLVGNDAQEKRLVVVLEDAGREKSVTVLGNTRELYGLWFFHCARSRNKLAVVSNVAQPVDGSHTTGRLHRGGSKQPLVTKRCYVRHLPVHTIQLSYCTFEEKCSIVAPCTGVLVETMECGYTCISLSSTNDQVVITMMTKEIRITEVIAQTIRAMVDDWSLLYPISQVVIKRRTCCDASPFEIDSCIDKGGLSVVEVWVLEHGSRPASLEVVPGCRCKGCAVFTPVDEVIAVYVSYVHVGKIVARRTFLEKDMELAIVINRTIGLVGPVGSRHTMKSRTIDVLGIMACGIVHIGHEVSRFLDVFVWKNSCIDFNIVDQSVKDIQVITIFLDLLAGASDVDGSSASIEGSQTNGSTQHLTVAIESHLTVVGIHRCHQVAPLITRQHAVSVDHSQVAASIATEAIVATVAQFESPSSLFLMVQVASHRRETILVSVDVHCRISLRSHPHGEGKGIAILACQVYFRY